MTSFEQLLEKMARGQQLSENEIGDLKLLARSIDESKNIMQTWAPNPRNTSSPVLSDDPVWNASPLHAYSFQMQTDKAVLNNTDTIITFDTFIQHGSKFQVDPTDATKILINSPLNPILITGVVNWNNNATGYRYIALEGFKSDGTSLGFIGLHLFQGTATEDNSFPVAFVADPLQLAEMAYMKFHLRQTSGTTLTCFYVLLTACIV